MFLYRDQVEITILSGSGGAGSTSFRRERKVPRGGPDGGNGGRGGDVIVQADESIKNLETFVKKRRWKAEDGLAGSGQLKTGRDGKHLSLSVPLGTVVRSEKNLILADLKSTQGATLLKGGQGGKGNAFFKSSSVQAPRHAQSGQKGKQAKVILEYKPIIQISLIGLPNSGKSSFFNKITEARSPIGSYPYTTLKPYYGRIKDIKKTGLIMDIPGLMSGASKSERRGLSFLRLIQRAQLLIHFIDSTNETADKAEEDIVKELEMFDKKFNDQPFSPLSNKKRLLVFSKIDLLPKIPSTNKDNVFFISSKTGQGVKELVIAIEKEIL